MKAVKMVLLGGVGMVTLVGAAAPAAAQYYPGYGGYGTGNVVGQVIDTILGASRYGQGAYGYANDRLLIDRCAASVEQRINREYGYRYGSPYGGYGGAYGGYGGGYGYNQAGGARVVGIDRVERRSYSTIRVRGTATANAYAAGGYGGYGAPYGGYGGGYGGYNQAGEFRFKCDIDARGYIRDIDLDRNNYGYRYDPYRRGY